MLIPTNFDQQVCSLMGGLYEWLSDIWDTKECSLFNIDSFFIGGRAQCLTLVENRDFKGDP